ncbi:MAG: glycoside hydrolase family 4 [Planctomycetaceae bacterium]|nr:glycoside hydrolase family 4 [Planctomycetaceae bacterium]
MLVDTDARVLRTMAGLARRVFKHTKCGVKTVASTKRREVLAGSDFVVLSFSHGNAHYRGVDTQIAAKHGMRMCSSDTIGPGGIFRTLRELPNVVAMAKDAHRLAPDAWVINFVNPTTTMGMGLRRYAPEVRSFALCDGHHEPYCTLEWCKVAGIVPQRATEVPPDVRSRLDLRIGGVNHFTWMVRFTYEGKDMLPAVRRWLRDEMKEHEREPHTHSKIRWNPHYSMQLFDLYGAYPTAIGHTKEYVPFFQGQGVKANKPEPITTFDADARAAEMAADGKQTASYAKGASSPRAFLRNTHDDHATDIIESMYGGLGKPFYINTANGGAVTNLPDDAFIELRCDIDLRGPRPHPFGEMPRGVLALQHQLLDTHELTAEAAMTGDKALLRRAMLTDPICNNIGDADACIRDLLATEREALPGFWFKRR